MHQSLSDSSHLSGSDKQSRRFHKNVTKSSLLSLVSLKEPVDLAMGLRQGACTHGGLGRVTPKGGSPLSGKIDVRTEVNAKIKLETMCGRLV